MGPAEGAAQQKGQFAPFAPLVPYSYWSRDFAVTTAILSFCPFCGAAPAPWTAAPPPSHAPSYGPPAPPLSRAIRRRTPEHQPAKVGRVAIRKPFSPRRPRPVLTLCDIHRRAAPRSTRPAAFPHPPMSPSHAIPGQLSGPRPSRADALRPPTRGVHASYPPHHLPPRSRVL